MEPLNYFRQAAEYLMAAPQQLDYAVKILQSVAKIDTPKFRLPDGGELFSDMKRPPMPERLILPYPVVVVEYADALSKEIIIAVQADLYEISVTYITGQLNAGKEWLFHPYSVKLPTTQTVTDGVAGYNLQLMLLEGSAKLDAETEQLANSFINNATRPLLDLLAALALPGTQQDVLPARKLNKSAKRRGALPFDEYKVLKINLEEVARATAPATDSTEVTERRSPREHKRRGHNRTYRSGKRVWIEATTINRDKGGRIDKDYVIT